MRRQDDDGLGERIPLSQTVFALITRKDSAAVDYPATGKGEATAELHFRVFRLVRPRRLAPRTAVFAAIWKIAGFSRKIVRFSKKR
jgi:hypothetical protein